MLYVFINVAALGLMIYTRRQVITQVNIMIMPPILFLSFLLAFGNWYMLIPPICVIVVMFFVCWVRCICSCSSWAQRPTSP